MSNDITSFWSDHDALTEGACCRIIDGLEEAPRNTGRSLDSRAVVELAVIVGGAVLDPVTCQNSVDKDPTQRGTRRSTNLSDRIGNIRNLEVVVGRSDDVRVGKVSLLGEHHHGNCWVCGPGYRDEEQARERVEQDPLEYMLLREQGIARERDTNCDIFSWASSQFAVCAWNMAAIAAASSSFATPLGRGACKRAQLACSMEGRQNALAAGAAAELAWAPPWAPCHRNAWTCYRQVYATHSLRLRCPWPSLQLETDLPCLGIVRHLLFQGEQALASQLPRTNGG